MKQVGKWQRTLTPPRILVLGFALLILTGALLLTLPLASQSGTSLSVTDALFTATSAVCVTGLVVVDTGSYFTHFGQVVILLLIQLGALGFMTLATFITVFTGIRIGLKERLILQTSLNVSSLEGLIRLSRSVVLLTLSIEAVVAVVLSIRFSYDMPVGKAIYFGVFHSVSAFCNAGFDLFGNSLINYKEDVTVNLAVMTLIILGGLGFVVMVDLMRLRKGERLTLHSKIVLIMTGILLAAGTLGYYLIEMTKPGAMQGLSASSTWLTSAFASVSARTAGFGTIDYSQLSDTGMLWTIFLMFIGASPGSTGGGIKTVTAFLILLYVWTVVTNRSQTTIFKRAVAPLLIYKSLVIVVLSGLLVMIGTILLTVTEEAELVRLFFEATSAFATVGLSTNLTFDLSDPGKCIIIALMFIGKLGPLTIAVALAARQPQKDSVKYPEENLYVG
ncbi:TrkH family potassium uptake protein [Tumebacillus sp. DT12]|uniref:TrkH family potassium uptake protein n=1 Tax=Tumebacillus lacus TaxID=2995335 RepID=A0ABT3WXS4_9BACL|nr:TrkH family potassium uptake protein [Tumebacillus lacus]MCX7569431.1 TrkH family potassium uptake protein [Tumebacillus lacus]